VQNNDVIAVDTIPEKVDLINNKKSPISDVEIEDFLVNKDLSLTATTDKNLAYKYAEFVVIAYFNTNSVEALFRMLLLLIQMR
jgi:UDPglucose 6-dehydrogenase